MVVLSDELPSLLTVSVTHHTVSRWGLNWRLLVDRNTARTVHTVPEQVIDGHSSMLDESTVVLEE